VSLIDLSGKVALVTGGSRGIGAATAVVLARAGAEVAITYRTRVGAAEQVLDRIRGCTHHPVPAPDGIAHARSPIAIRADVSLREECEQMVRRVVEAFGKLDIFVANAGIWPPEQVGVAEMSDEQWKTTVAVNLDSVFFGCRAALQAMLRERGAVGNPAIMQPSAGGSIVIVSSTASQRGEAFHADYAASKGAVNAFVKSLGVEAAPYGINVNAVAPGWVDTEMCDIPFEREQGVGKREIEAGIPLGRVASPEDIAGPIVFLCSHLARHIAGEVLNVNGGAVLCG